MTIKTIGKVLGRADYGSIWFFCPGCDGPHSIKVNSFVTDGRIPYRGDCTHALTWQTVDLLGGGMEELVILRTRSDRTFLINISDQWLN